MQIYRDTSTEAVRTLLAYGYTIEAPTSETGEASAAGIVILLTTFIYTRFNDSIHPFIIHLSVYVSKSISFSPSPSLHSSQSISLGLCLSVHFSQSISLSLCLLVHFSSHLSQYTSLCLSLSVYFSSLIFPSQSLSVHLSQSISQSILHSISHALHISICVHFISCCLSLFLYVCLASCISCRKTYM